MAQFNHRINLKKAAFPMLSSELGRTVLIPNSKEASTGEDANEPEILYMHNVMPTSRGLQSVGFKDIIPAPTGGDATIYMYRVLHIDHVATDAAGTVFVADDPHIMGLEGTAYLDFYFTRELSTPIWTVASIPSYSPIVEYNITVANMVGESYILLRQNLPYCYSVAHGIIVKAFAGSPLPFIMGITGAFGYLIAWGGQLTGQRDTTVVWSSLLDPLDLTPSAVTGAGTASVEGAKGQILHCEPNSTGFLVYCWGNVVAAIYTGNKSYPFKFVPIEGSKGLGNSSTLGGGTDYRAVAGLIATNNADDYGHFIFAGTGGLQLVNSKKAELLFPEITDFMTGGLLEDFNETTKAFTQTVISSGYPMMKKVAYIASRYLVISYGLPSTSILTITLTHALIYDLKLERLGKVKIDHTEVFENSYSGSHLTDKRDISKESIAFMTNTGAVSVLSFDPDDTTRTGVLILGKYQYVRDRFITLQKVTCENVDAADSFTFTDMPSLDGRNTSSLVTGTETSGVGYREFALRSAGKNHSLAFIGEFILNTVELLFTISGRR